jgi:lipopolysaccharide transport system permease protein
MSDQRGITLPSDRDIVTALAGLEISSKEFLELRPSSGLLDLELGNVWRYRELLYFLIWRDLKVRYRQAIFGAGWAIAQPLFAVLIFTAVFGLFAKIPSDGVPYPLFAFSAMLPWTYFAEAVRRSSTGLVVESDLIRKVYFPRLVIPLVAVIAPLVDFLIAFVIFIAMSLWYGVIPGWQFIMVFPLIVFAAALALGVGLWLGPINVRFRDVMHTVPFVLQIWMYASPIVYPLSLVPEQWKALYSLNPMVGVIEGFRWALLGKESPDITAMALSAAFISALLLGGLIFFRRMERSFADLI